jgi:secreted trypsin-like serine protease
MSFSYESWQTENASGAISGGRRAIAAWRRIQRDPTSVTILREVTTLDAQTVRVVPETTQGSEDSESPVTATITRYLLFGVRNHPTADDTDVQRDDLFRHHGQLLRVTAVRTYPGQVQATCEAAE